MGTGTRTLKCGCRFEFGAQTFYCDAHTKTTKRKNYRKEHFLDADDVDGDDLSLEQWARDIAND